MQTCKLTKVGCFKLICLHLAFTIRRSRVYRYFHVEMLQRGEILALGLRQGESKSRNTILEHTYASYHFVTLLLKMAYKAVLLPTCTDQILLIQSIVSCQVFKAFHFQSVQ